jgi:hypothetical protein
MTLYDYNFQSNLYNISKKNHDQTRDELQEQNQDPEFDPMLCSLNKSTSRFTAKHLNYRNYNSQESTVNCEYFESKSDMDVRE